MDKILAAMAGLAAGALTTATVTKSLSYDVKLVSYEASVGGDFVMRLDFVKQSTGKSIAGRTIRVPVTGPIVDGDGQQITANVPAGFTNARTAFEAQINTMLDNAAAAGKLDP